MALPPRYLPNEPLPPYAYLPRRAPHPTRDPAGHSFGHHLAPPAVPDPNRWDRCQPYLRGIDLFNYGYYWEAHEAWESVWHACGRIGLTADFLRALIRLAAAGFKAREGRPAGVRRHAAAAAELFERAASIIGGEHPRHMGLCLTELARFAKQAEQLPNAAGMDMQAQMVIFTFVLKPE